MWDGNEVWLLTAGGALFAAFAPAYAATFSGFYLAIMLVLFGLILRAVSLEFRAHEDKYPKLWDGAFFIGSLLPALLFGVAAGNVIAGIPLNEAGDYTGTFFALLNPFALVCGLLGLAVMLTQGCAWLALKTDAQSALHGRAAAWRRVFALAALVLLVCADVLYLVVVMPEAVYPVFSMAASAICTLLAAGGLVAILVAGRTSDAGSDKPLMGAVSLSAVALVAQWAVSTFPYLVPAQTVELSLTVANSASSDTALTAMTIIACIGVPLMIAYQVIAYRIFRGRV